VAVAVPDAIPLDLVCQASSLDTSQARALIACLTQELAVVQGPPGTGDANELKIMTVAYYAYLFVVQVEKC
jgi:hypothetical protein